MQRYRRARFGKVLGMEPMTKRLPRIGNAMGRHKGD